MRRHLYYYTHLALDPETALGLLRDQPRRWLPDPGMEYGDGWLVDLRADGALPRSMARHSVVVDLGQPSGDTGRELRSITWRSASAPGLFPVFHGDLELTSLSPDTCQLSLMGTYRPPLMVAGDAGDALLGHHVAEACVRRFVLDTAQRMVGVTLDA